MAQVPQKPPVRRRRTRARLAAAALVLIAVVVVAGLTLPGRKHGILGVVGHAPASRPAPVADAASSLADAMAKPWPKVQKPNGHFRSSVGGGTRYGDAMLGYALVQHGLETGDKRLVDSGLRGLDYAFPRARLHARQSVFESLAFAGAYNLAKDHLTGNPLFTRHRAVWEDELKRITIERLGATTYYGNHWLIEAVMVQELLKSGLHSNRVHAILGGDRAEASRLSEQLINVRIPGMARAGGRVIDGDRTFVLSDPPDNPLSYQGLSLGFYARAVHLLGDRAAPAARRTLLEVANASTWLMGPDGDVGYFGRNQEEPWSLGATEYGAAVAAGQPGAKNAGEYRGLVTHALDRLRTVHGIGHFGLFITPSVRESRIAGQRGLDSGAGGPSFAGMTLALVDWSVPELQAHPGPVAQIRSEQDGGAILARSDSEFAVSRRGPVWFAVRGSPSGKHPEELRNDFGIVALKVRGPGGRWIDLLRLRPITHGKPDSAGPLLHEGPRIGFPYGTRMRVTRGGTIVVDGGGFRIAPSPFKRIVAQLDNGTIVRALDFTPGPVMRTGVAFRFRPTRCGVRLSFPNRPGDQIEYSLFQRDEPGLRVRPQSVRNRHGGELRLSRPATAQIEHGYASALDPALVRIRMTLQTATAPMTTLALCQH